LVSEDFFSGNFKFCQNSIARRDLITRGAKVLDSVGAARTVVVETAEGEFNNRLRRSRSFEE